MSVTQIDGSAMDAESRRSLQRLSLLEGVGEPACEHLLASFGVAAFASGTVILAEGNANDRLWVVLSGSLDVKLLEVGNRMCEVDLGELYEGDVFGEYSIFDGEPVSASVIARRPSRIAWVSKSELDHFVEAFPADGRRLYDNLMRKLIARLRAKNDEVDLRKTA